MPNLELLKAVVAGARGRCPGVEVGILVKWHDGAGVRVAEDVTASPAVVTSGKVVEVALAGWVVADGGLGVRLPVLARRQRCDLGEEIEIPLSVEALAAVASRAAREALADTSKARDGDEAVAGAAGGQSAVGLGITAGLGADGLHGGELAVGSEDSGHVKRADMAGVVGLGGGGSRCVVVAEIRGAQRRDLGSWRNLVGLGAAVVVDGPLLGEEVV